jgi:hypothetical protein
MGVQKYFQLSRFWLLVKLEIFKARKGIVMTVVITFGLLFFMGLLFALAVAQNLVVYEHTTGYIFALLTGGFILTSLAFNDLSSTLKRYNYLTLPVSTFERFFCMWLLTSIGWVILFTAAYTLYTLIVNVIGPILFSQVKFMDFNPLNPAALQGMLYYFVLQGVFLVGAAKFKGYVFPKTLFTLIIFATVCSFLGYFLMADMVDVEPELFEDPEIWLETSVFKIWQVVQRLFWILLAPLCWVVTYMALKEKEV